MAPIKHPCAPPGIYCPQAKLHARLGPSASILFVCLPWFPLQIGPVSKTRLTA